MQVVGKCPPTAAALDAAAERGFDAVELHCPVAYTDDVAVTAQVCREAPVDVATVHTPHVGPDRRDGFRDADQLARALDARLVVHSQYYQNVHVDEIESLDLAAPRAYENNVGVSVRHLRAVLLDRGHDLVLDTAHLYTAHENYVERFESLLYEDGERIPVVHLADGSLLHDGLAFGEGEMDLAALVDVLRREYEGIVVLEVMPEDQQAALAAFRNW